MQARFLTKAELEVLRNHMTDEEWLPFAISLASGLRVGDLVKIRYSDFVGGQKLRYIAEKTKKSGIIELPSDLVSAIFRRYTGRSKWVFPSPKNQNQHITRQALYARIKKAAEKADISIFGISPHSFRKTFAVDLYHKSGIQAVKESLQHTDVITTEIYALSDWLTGENAKKPLLREDMEKIVACVRNALYLK